MLNIKSFPVILLHWVCLISRCFCVCVCARVLCQGLCPKLSVYGCLLVAVGCLVVCSPLFLPFSCHFLSLLTQLKHMIVMTGYPDFLLEPELIDQEYEVSHHHHLFHSAACGHPYHTYANPVAQQPALPHSVFVFTVFFSMTHYYGII